MKALTGINLIDWVYAIVFLLPLIKGFFMLFTRERIRYAISSLLDNLEYIFGMIISVYLTKKIFFDNDSYFFNFIYRKMPEAVKALFDGRYVLTYIIVAPIILFFVMILLRLMTNPLHRYLTGPVSDKIFYILSGMGSLSRRTIGALCQLPGAVFLVFMISIFLNFLNYYAPIPTIGKWMKESVPYQVLYQNAVYPVLNSNIVKRIPVIINNSFSKLATDLNYDVKVIEYFNGVTLDEAVKSSAEIDKTAETITRGAKNTREKALAIYGWITENVEYDYDKVEKISRGAKDIDSGALVAYKTGRGICFDHSSLYVAMGRAAGLKVRLVTGLGYSGLAWGDHAWNQVFIEEENRWINVDTTFGISGVNYFDKEDFAVDHKYAQVQGEW